MTRWFVVACWVLLALLGWAPERRAFAATGEGYIPESVVLPAKLSIQEALRVFRSRGLDLLIADANVMGAQGSLQSASGIANPNAFVQAGPTFNYSARSPCSGCEEYYLQWGLSDNAAVFDSLSGKRGLRVQAARAALESAKLARVDAERQLEAQVKQQYVQVVFAAAQLDFAREVQIALGKTADLAKVQYDHGAINEGDLARIDVQRLEADQSVDTALLNLRQSKVGLAFLLGVRSDVPDFDVDRTLVTYFVPKSLDGKTEHDLLALAVENRPDLKQLGWERLRAESSLALAKRQRFPDVTLSTQYSQLGQGQSVGQPMSLVFGVSMNLPAFYQQQGEIRQARADLDTQALTHAKTGAQVVNDVGTSYAQVAVSRELVERMEKTILKRARVARDITEIQYKNGAVKLMDYLDAIRTYIATNTEYLQDLSDYWTAVYQLEQAVGVELP